ncbi:hypothetical protein AX16_006784 [Volvariella volvacea WC 439]|nr:hypothetical protein AX16_006784 [Volvariella volvacea WC 439]
MTTIGPRFISDEESQWYREPPPRFGHSMLRFFALDPGYINLNHGSFGSLPLPVQAANLSISAQIELNPDYFSRSIYHPFMNGVREKLAKILHVDTEECVMVPNVSYGINTILRNFEWSENDILISTATAYDSIRLAISYITDRPPYPRHSEFSVSFPTSHKAIISQFSEHVRKVINRLNSSRTKPRPKIVAVFDAISCHPGVLWPWREMVQICKQAGIWSVVDAAHSIGQETYIDLHTVDPDFWVSNCNKWLYAKRGCAVMYVPFRNQPLIKDTLLPALIYPMGVTHTPFVAKFFWSGSADVAPSLTVCAALDFREYLGGSAAINHYCHELALAGGKRLAEILETCVMESPENVGELTLNMVNVLLPIYGSAGPSSYVSQQLQFRLLFEEKISGSHYYHNGKWWIRLCCQIYNEISDFEKLGSVLKTICKELSTEIKASSVAMTRYHHVM